MSGLEKDRTMFYSTFSNEIEGMLQEGKRIFSFIEINKKEFPEGLVKRSAGTPNCKIIINDNSIDISKLGDNRGLIMKKNEVNLYHFPITDVEYIQLDIKKLMNTYKGSYILYLDIKRKTIANPLKFSINAITPLTLIWNAKALSTIKKKINSNFLPLLDDPNSENLQNKIDLLSIDIPLVTD